MSPEISFLLSIADISFQVQVPSRAWLDALQARYQPFLTEGAPDWQIWLYADESAQRAGAPLISHQGDITRFRAGVHRGRVDLAARQAQVTAPTVDLGAHALERTLAFICMQELPRRWNGLLLHAAGVVYRGQGLVFCGPSGSGKTTTAGLALGHGTVLNDEALVVSLAGPAPVVVSTPFWGVQTPHSLIHRVRRQVPLFALLLLEHGTGFELEPLSASQAVLALLATEQVAVERVSSASAWLRVAEGLVQRVPVYRLHFQPTTDLWGFLDTNLLAD